MIDIADINEQIRIFPLNTENYLIRGKYYLSQNLFGLAINDFNQVIKLDANNFEAFENLSETYFQWGAFLIDNKSEKEGNNLYLLGEESLNKLIDMNPNNIDYFLKRFFHKIIRNDYLNALKDYDKIVELDKNEFYKYFPPLVSFIQEIQKKI